MRSAAPVNGHRHERRPPTPAPAGSGRPGDERTAELPVLSGYTVAVTATRRRHEFGAALQRHGAAVVYAPAVRIIAPTDDSRLRETTRHCLTRAPDIVVATTGVGFRGWLEAAAGWDLLAALHAVLDRAELIARGPTVRGAVRAAGLTEAWAPESESSRDVLDHLLSRPLHGTCIAVQLHGEPLGWFLDALGAAGAEVIAVPVYRSVLPEDGVPLRRLMAAVAGRQVDAVAFTSAAASANFLAVAARFDDTGIRRALHRDVIAACVGPVTAAPLTAVGIPVIQPERFRLGDLVEEICDQVPLLRNRCVHAGDHALEIRGQAVVVDGVLLPVASAGIALLRKLAERPGQVVACDDLSRALPVDGADGHTVEVAIGRLRASLENPQLVETVVTRGYRLAPAGR